MPPTINNPFEKKAMPTEKVVNRVPTPNQEAIGNNEPKIEEPVRTEAQMSIDDLFDLGEEMFFPEVEAEKKTQFSDFNDFEEKTPSPMPSATVVPPVPAPVQQPPVQRQPIQQPPMTQAEKPTQKPKRKEGQAKILPNDDMKRVEKEFVDKRRAIKELNVKPMVLSVLGAKSGVGVTTVAFNLAVSLAKDNFKVLYIELNDNGIPFSFNYQLENGSNGLETALEKVNNGNINDAFNHVTKMKELKKEYKGTEYSSLYNKYPNSLDYIAFSQRFILDTDRTYQKEGLAQLLMSALLTEGYQYIIIDINVHSDADLIAQALKNSKGVFSVVTQNMTSVAQNINYLEQVHQKVINLNKKLYFVINEYENEGISSKALSKWINQEMDFKHEDVLVVPNFSKQIIKANAQYLPITLASSAKDVQNAYKTLANYTRMF